MDEKSLEDRLRRGARAHGLVLRKSRRRDPNALDFGTYTLVNEELNAVVWPCSNVTLDDVAATIAGLDVTA